MAYYDNSFQPDLQDYHYSASYYTTETAAATGNYKYASYDYAMPQSSVTDYNYNYCSNTYLYNHQPAYDYYAASDFTVGYCNSVSTYSHPNLIEFDPSASAYSRVYSPAQTQCIISYSVSDFNEPEFLEYDPTPYGGGYDITKTYGKPLPPSEGICYPRSNVDPNAQILVGMSPESAKSPYGMEDQVGRTPEKPGNGSKPTMLAAEEEREKTAEKPENGSRTTLLAAEEDKQQPLDDSDSHTSSHSECEEDLEEDIVDQPHPVPDCRVGPYDEFVARQIPPPPPPGYGLEAMDICECLFGYWPCLSRYKRECARQAAADGEWICNNNGQDAAHYLFGGQDPYADGETRDYRSSYGGSLW